ALLAESLVIARGLRDQCLIAALLAALAPVATAAGRPARAAQLWGAAERLREEVGSALPPNERDRCERQVTAARASLGEETAFDVAWQAGRAMTLEQAIEYALGEP